MTPANEVRQLPVTPKQRPQRAWNHDQSSFGGGDGGSDNSGERLKALEVQFERFSKDMQTLLDETKALRIDTAEIKGQLKSMPTTLQLILGVVAIFTAAGITRWFGH